MIFDGNLSVKTQTNEFVFILEVKFLNRKFLPQFKKMFRTYQRQEFQ